MTISGNSIGNIDLAAEGKAALHEEAKEDPRLTACVERVLRQPSAAFPLGVSEFGEAEGFPVHVVIQAFSRLAGRERSLHVYFDRRRSDLSLGFR